VSASPRLRGCIPMNVLALVCEVMRREALGIVRHSWD